MIFSVNFISTICLISSKIKFNTFIYVPHVYQNFVFLPAGGENSSYNVKVNVCIYLIYLPTW